MSFHGRKGGRYGKNMARKKKTQPNLKHEEIWGLVACPECCAWKGAQCTEKGKVRTKNHAARVEAAIKWVQCEVGRPRLPFRPRTKPASVAKDFYDTWEWKEARFAALKRHGRQCQCCGWTPGASLNNHLVVDHIRPLRTHPQLALDPENHQVLCNDCNMGKSFKHHDDFR